MSDNFPESDRFDGLPHPRETRLLFGHLKAQNDFAKAIKNKKIHHAWLLTGPKGIGKATLAWKMAGYLLSLARKESINSELTPFTNFIMQSNDPLFKRILALSEPKLQLIRKTWDPKTEKFRQSISIDDIRAIKQFFNLSSTDEGQRVVIIDSADDLQNSSANALLKILEEPPKRTTILMISHNPTTLLPTIKSRCQKLNLQPLSTEDLKQGLNQAIEIDNPISNDLYTLSGGSIGNAATLISNDGTKIYSQICDIFSGVPNMSRVDILSIISELTKSKSDDYFETLISMLSIFIRRLATTGAGGLPKIEIGKNEFSILKKLSSNLTQARLWSEESQDIFKTALLSKNVNLEPSSIILNMFLSFNNIAIKAHRQEGL